MSNQFELKQTLEKVEKFLEKHENVQMDDPLFLLVMYAEGMQKVLKEIIKT